MGIGILKGDEFQIYTELLGNKKWRLRNQNIF